MAASGLAEILHARVTDLGANFDTILVEAKGIRQLGEENGKNLTALGNEVRRATQE